MMAGRNLAVVSGVAACLLVPFGSAVRASSLEPAAILNSNLRITLSYAGQVKTSGSSNNIASPVPIGDKLYVVDQGAGRITIQGDSGPTEALSPTDLPAGINLTGSSKVTNIAGLGDTAYVGFRASNNTTGLTAEALPADARYDGTKVYDLIYLYDRSETDGTLSNPRPLAAFEAMENGHKGEGMLVLPDGRLVLSRGDNLSPSYNGLRAPQQTTSSLGSLLIIDQTGTVEVAAKGIRNAQRLTYDVDGETIYFSDIGWTVAEEINSISLDDLSDTSVIENFGWGVDGDGVEPKPRAREGTFYVNEGPEAVAMAVGEAPVGEAGFVQPFAQFGRESFEGYFAVTGPVTSESFTDIGLLFGDLVRGELYATQFGATGILNDVNRVTLLGSDGNATTLSDMFNMPRVELRFFNFTDGGAGLMSERNGEIYRIAEVTTPVPLPSAGGLLAAALGAVALLRRRRTGYKPV